MGEMASRALQMTPKRPMTDDTPTPAFPDRQTLAEFFRLDPRKRVRVAALSRLLDAPDQQVRRLLLGGGVPSRFDTIEWGEAAVLLFDAWPRTQIIEVLGPEARLIPPAFQPAPVQWQIPIFIIRAIQHQAALAWENDPRVNPAVVDGRFTPHAVDDYVADILLNEIQPATVDALGHDPEFFQAYHYPPVD
jgi:hypothetical protein